MVTGKTFEDFRTKQIAISKAFLKPGEIETAKGILFAPVPPTSSDDKDAQDALKSQYQAVLACINRIEKLKSEIIVPTTNNLNSCFNVINVQRIVSPTNNYLGKSFASVIEDNVNILAKGIDGERRQGWFGRIAKIIVNNPIITTLAKSNPLTSVAHDVINQALSASEGGGMTQSILNEFNGKIEPYLKFYGSIDEKTDRFYDKSLQFETSLTLTQGRLEKINGQIEELLSPYNGKIEEKLMLFFNYSNADSMTTANVLRVLTSTKVTLLKRHIENVVRVEEDLSDINHNIKTRFNSYIDDLKKILDEAAANQDLKFDANAIKIAKDGFREMV